MARAFRAQACTVSEESMTAGRRLFPVTPGKSVTTMSPALNKSIVPGSSDGIL